LKGAGRPLNNETDRALVLAALESVTAVCIFPQVRASEFLAEARPDIYVKGGDYTLETLNQEERRIVESAGGRIVFIPFVEGKSTTGLVQKIGQKC
jgi:rfaE bifunctional protein nucleotidyltransferase chain/domain